MTLRALPFICKHLLHGILLLFITACQLLPIESTMVQPISPLASSVVASVPRSQSTLATVQSYHVTWTTRRNTEQSQFLFTWVRAGHEWGFDHSVQVFLSGPEDVAYIEEYLIGDTAYGRIMDDPFESLPRHEIADISPFSGDLILQVEPRPEQEAVIFPMEITAIPFAILIAQLTPTGEEELEGIPAIHYQISDPNALELLEAALRTSHYLQPWITLSAIQGEFWLTGDRTHVLRYVIVAKGTAPDGQTPLTIHEEYVVSAINQIPTITLPAVADAQLAVKAQETAADRLVHPTCSACIFPKPAGVRTANNPMSGGRFVNFEFALGTDDPTAGLALYEAQLEEFGWQIVARTVDEERPRSFPAYTWSVEQRVEGAVEAFTIVGYGRVAEHAVYTSIEISPRDLKPVGQ